MHCFKDDEGEEQWGFIPPDHLTELSRLTDTDTAHDYFIDGAPAIYMDSSQKILLFGERRGGEKYYALDVTDPYTPRWQYEIDSYILSIIDFDNSGFTEGAGAQLGQSWCTPKIGKMRTGAMTGQWEPVLIFGGGYDTNQDNATPNPTDSLGRAVFAVNALDKSVNVLDFNYALYNQMTHCIVDVTAVDTTGDGFINKIYAGDLGGQVFAFRDKDANGNWTARKLFVAKENSSDTVLRKIFYAPDVTRETFGDYIFFGTGNRADPNEDTVVNRVYAVQNHWDATFTDNTDTMDETDLYDATDNFIQQGAAEKRTEEEALLASKRGWFFELNPGEKVVSETIVFAGVVYFTTYEPVTSAVVNDCDVVSGSGIARLYAVDYRTGGAIYDWSPTIEKDETGEDIEGLGKSDRSLTIGTTMPSAPVIAVLEGGPQLFVGVGGGGGGGGGLFQFPPKRKVDMNLFYWWQQLSS